MSDNRCFFSFIDQHQMLLKCDSKEEKDIVSTVVVFRSIVKSHGVNYPVGDYSSLIFCGEQTNLK